MSALHVLVHSIELTAYLALLFPPQPTSFQSPTWAPGALELPLPRVLVRGHVVLIQQVQTLDLLTSKSGVPASCSKKNRDELWNLERFNIDSIDPMNPIKMMTHRL